MGFSRQEYWSGLPFPSPGNLPEPGIEPQVSCISKRIFHRWATWEALLTAVASYSLPTCTGEEESLSGDSLLLQLLQGIMKADFRKFYFFSFDAHRHSVLSLFYICCLFSSVIIVLFSFIFFQRCFIYLFYHIAHLFLVFYMLPFLAHMSLLKKKVFFPLILFHFLFFELSQHSVRRAVSKSGFLG